MTEATTPPAVSEAMREAVARPAPFSEHLDEIASILGSQGFHIAALRVREAVSELTRLSPLVDEQRTARGEAEAETQEPETGEANHG